MARRVTLRRVVLEEKATRAGYQSQSDLARALDVNQSVHNRALNGKLQELSGYYVLQVLEHFGGPEVQRVVNELFERDAA